MARRKLAIEEGAEFLDKPVADLLKGLRRISEVPLDSLKIPPHAALRGDVRGLADSIAEVGLLNPITITAGHRLLAGFHRVEAYRLLGRESIEAIVLDLDGVRAELATLDENLLRADFGVLERSEKLAERKELYLQLHPETGHGKAPVGRGGKKEDPESGSSFVDDTASKLGVSRSTVAEEVQIASAIPAALRDELRGTPLADEKTKLLKIAKLRDNPEAQAELAHEFLGGFSGLANHSSASVEWYTPARYLDAARVAVGGEFDLDPASTPQANEKVGAKRIYTREDDGLGKRWKGRVWLNPPYGETETGESAAGVWGAKLIAEHAAGRVTTGMLLVNAVTDRKWFQQFWDFPICFTDHRIEFYTPSGQPRSPVSGNAFVLVGGDAKTFAAAFTEIGPVVLRVQP